NDFVRKHLNVDGQKVNLQVWDNGNIEKFSSIDNIMYKNTKAIFLIFNHGDLKSFTTLKSNYQHLLNKLPNDSKTLVLGITEATTASIVNAQEVKTFVEQNKLVSLNVNLDDKNEIVSAFAALIRQT